MAKSIGIKSVPKDLSDVNLKSVYNPLKIDFVHRFDGEEFVLQAGKRTTFPENVAVHMAKHLAKKIVTYVADEEREALLETIADGKEKVTVQMKPYPRFDRRVGNVAKLLVGEVSDSDDVDKSNILKTASEEAVKEKTVNSGDIGDSFKDEPAKDALGDDKGESSDEQSQYSELSRKELQEEVKVRGLEIAGNSKSEALVEALEKDDSDSASE